MLGYRNLALGLAFFDTDFHRLQLIDTGLVLHILVIVSRLPVHFPNSILHLINELKYISTIIQEY